MGFMLTHFDVGDYDAWKERFDTDPVERKQTGKGHQIYRSVDNQSEVFVGLEFASVEEATAFRERLLASGVLDAITVKTPPTVVEIADTAEY